MPELPDLTVYIEAIERHALGQTLERIRIANPFVLRTVAPAPGALEGRRVERVSRIGKRLVLSLEGGLHAVAHLMVAGRLRWLAPRAKLPAVALAAFDFAAGSLVLTEAGKKRRASVHLVAGDEALASLDPGGLEVLRIDAAQFTARLTLENHTLKRALTDPRLFSGIGNAYSDEILHRARLSPLALTHKLGGDEIERLFAALRAVLQEWTQRLRAAAGAEFPEKVTAFRPEMAVHGRYKAPCPDCGSPVQRIVYAENEANYCARCQTGGKRLADRALSRLLKKSWPRSIDETI